MTGVAQIPAFALYGEQAPFPDVVHYERFSARAPDHDWRIAPHRHDQMVQLILVETGQVEAILDGQTYLLSDQEYLYIPDNCVHSFVFDPATRGFVLSLPLGVVSSVSPSTAQIRGALAAPICAPAGAQLRQLVALIAEISQGSGDYRAQQLVGVAHAILAHLAERSRAQHGMTQHARPPKLVALDDLIERSMAKGWSAAQYAQALSVTTGHLSRLCRAATGRGVSAYIEQKVTTEACRLLAFTQLPIAEIGYRLGYRDPSYFSKRFRAVQGRSPTDYRRVFTDTGPSPETGCA